MKTSIGVFSLRVKPLLATAALTALFVAGVGAATTEQEAAKLGKELTPVGAERAGNKDGSIPE